MKHIMCFGDSLTWGFNVATMNRFEYTERWTGILQKSLGVDYRIIEEGLNGRTTVFDDPFSENKNGSRALPMLLETHAPLDLVIIMLGTNDLQPFRGVTYKEAARGYRTLISIIQKSLAGVNNGIPQILLLSPPLMKVNSDHIMALSFEGSENHSQKLAAAYQQVANFNNTHFLDTAQFVETDPIDGVHLDLKGNQLLAKALHQKILEIFG